jgi:hypothetical protein
MACCRWGTRIVPVPADMSSKQTVGNNGDAARRAWLVISCAEKGPPDRAVESCLVERAVARAWNREMHHLVHCGAVKKTEWANRSGRDKQADGGRGMVASLQFAEQVGSSSVSAHMGRADCLQGKLGDRGGMNLRSLKVMTDTVRHSQGSCYFSPMGAKGGFV